ncbi:MAG TPA: aromatic-ring-hydroxylating dioxygenase subunit beta [Burkholderiaceae bacterium]|nr:aromatic-ring-hydroxylating dioxygenase subunit beta [Burkholderiaceae bacterium]
MTAPTEQDLIRFVYREARMLDEKRFDEWYELFAEDGFYWVPLVPGQPDGIDHTSLAYEDRLLLKLRIERLKNPRSYSQHPESRGHHVLQMPEVETMDPQSNEYRTRTSLIYTETRGDEQQQYAVTVLHTLTMIDGRLRILLKRVNLLNCDAALPSIQMFI